MKVVFITNNTLGMYMFRREIVEETGKIAKTYLCAPSGHYESYWENVGCNFISCEFDRHSTNPMSEIKQLKFYIEMLREIQPDICFTYTIKPNVYAGMACSKLHIPYISNVTGLGDAIENGGLLAKISTFLYKKGLKHAYCVFFQNEQNRKMFLDNKLVSSKTVLLPGSGVNLEDNRYEKYPDDKNEVRFLFVGRIKKHKGIEELLEAAKIVKRKYSKFHLDIVGACEEDYEEALKQAEKSSGVICYGEMTQMHQMYERCHCVVLPSYHEGMSNVLLEGSATGRPVITTRAAGCAETFDEGISGFGCEVRDAKSLCQAMEKFMNLSNEQREKMGKAAREKMEREFDRKIVIDAYMRELGEALSVK